MVASPPAPKNSLFFCQLLLLKIIPSFRVPLGIKTQTNWYCVYFNENINGVCRNMEYKW